MRFAAVALALLLAPSAALAVCEDPNAPRAPGPDEAIDCDEDGFAPADGDCDDALADVNPDAVEVCANDRDDDCDGEVDVDCDDPHDRGSIQGGAGCGAGSPPLAAGVGLLLLGWRRRRRC